MMIPETLLKIKRPLRALFQGVIFALILLAVFTLGRISVLSAHTKEDPLEIIYPPLVTTPKTPYQEGGVIIEPSSWLFVASKTGKSYYPKGCKSADRIKPENRVYFGSEEGAKMAELTRSSLCPLTP